MNEREALAKAMREAYNLGQTYWQQADSEYTSQHRKADETRAKFEALVAETVAALASAPAATQGDPTREALIHAVKRMHSAKGRYHSQHATCDLYELLGLPCTREVIAAPTPQPTAPARAAEATQPAAAEQPTMDQVHAALRAANLMLVRTVHGLQVVPALKDAVAAQAPAGMEAAQQGRPCTCHPDDSPPNPCAKRYAPTECKAAEQFAPARDPRDEEAWQALGFLSGLHGFMTIDGDQPMKMAEAIFEHVQGEIKQWRDEAERCRAELVNLATERGELARWKMNQAAQKSHPQEGRMP